MNDLTCRLLLLAVPGLPLLLALPALRFRLDRPPCLALLPAIILVLLPLPVTADLPWLLLGTHLGLDAASRWLLAGQILVWTAAARVLQPDRDTVANRWQTTLFLLTQGGSLGVVLALDPVGFLAFSTVTGYGFYGLLAGTARKMTRRGGRAYLVAMILADLALLEAILIVAAAGGTAGFDSLRPVLAQSDARGMYLGMVLAGFALRAGAWPFHFWLRRLFFAEKPAVIILLPAVPVSLAMLGALRWLPPGLIHSPVPGWLLQGTGLAAMVHAILPGAGGKREKPVSFRLTLFATGLFSAILGMVLADPAIRSVYASWMYGSIGLFAPAMTGVLLVSHLRRRRGRVAAISGEQTDDGSEILLERLVSWVLSRCRRSGVETLTRWRSCGSAHLNRIRWIFPAGGRLLDKGEQRLRHWPLAMVLLLVLIIFMIVTGSDLSS